jgi:hypothetical protein
MAAYQALNLHVAYLHVRPQAGSLAAAKKLLAATGACNPDFNYGRIHHS